MIRCDFSDLQARILLQYGSICSFAKAMGISDRTLRAWLRNERPLSHDNLCKMVELLEIPDLEVERFFFRRADR